MVKYLIPLLLLLRIYLNHKKLRILEIVTAGIYLHKTINQKFGGFPHMDSLMNILLLVLSFVKKELKEPHKESTPYGFFISKLKLGLGKDCGSKIYLREIIKKIQTNKDNHFQLTVVTSYKE